MSTLVKTTFQGKRNIMHHFLMNKAFAPQIRNTYKIVRKNGKPENPQLTYNLHWLKYTKISIG